MPRLKYKAPKLYRKVRVSGSVDKDAFDILRRIMQAENRSLSNALNRVIYEAGAVKGYFPPPRQPQEIKQ